MSPKPTDPGEGVPKPTSTPVPTPVSANSAKNIKVEVVNFSGVKNLAEGLRSTLEANGYIVSAANKESTTPVATTIIEWHDKNAGAEIQKLLKAGKIVKNNDPSYRFDITINIGDDFMP